MGRSTGYIIAFATGVCLLFESGGRGCVAHVGDSRAYRLRAGRFEQLTEDHSVVGALIRMGRLTEQDSRRCAQQPAARHCTAHRWRTGAARCCGSGRGPGGGPP